MVRITRSGFEAVVDNRATLIVGSSEYLARYGIVTDRADASETGIIYTAMNSLLCAKINVFYKPQPLFEELSDILDEYGVRSVVETYDPLISGKYVAKCRGMVASLVSVVHKNVIDYNAVSKTKIAVGRAGVFASASRLKLVELVTFCKRLTKLRKINVVYMIASYVLAAGVSVLLTLMGGMEGVNLLWALLYQAAFVALYVVTSIKYLPLSFEQMQEKKIKEELKKQEEENTENYE